MSLRFPIALVLSIVCLAAPSVVGAEVQTFTATHAYVLGDHDSKDDARQRCLLETKRNILEQAGVYIESESEVRNFDLTKDTITSFAAAVMQVKNTKEEVSFQQGHMTMTLKLTAQVDLEEVRKQLAARHVDTSVRDDVAMQKERLKRLEAQFEEMQQHQGGQSSGHTPVSPPSDILAAEVEVQTLRTQAAQGDADAQSALGLSYENGLGVEQDYAKARQWYEQAAAQGHARALSNLAELYYAGLGVPQDYGKARGWHEKAAAQGDAVGQYRLGLIYANGLGVQQDYVRAHMWISLAAANLKGDSQKLIAGIRDKFARRMTPAQIAESRRLAQECQARQFKGC